MAEEPLESAGPLPVGGRFDEGLVKHGAQHILDYQETVMKVYPVSEDMLGRLDQASTLTTLGLAATTLFIGILASLWIAVSIVPTPVPAKVQGIEIAGFPLLVIAIVLSAALCIWGYRKRRSDVAAIRANSRSVPIGPSEHGDGPSGS